MEPTIEVYKMQHQRALECAATIGRLSESPEDANKNAQEIRMALASLAGVLKPHFTSEDRLVYPNLIASTDKAVAETADRFWKEMGGITNVVTDYLERWRKSGAIETEPADFIAACSVLFPALKARIDAEESELYPLFLSKSSSH